MNIVLIGTGNVGTILGRLIKDSTHSLVQLLGRSAEPTKQLAEELNCPFILHPEKLSSTADIYLLAIQDKEIPVILPKLKLPAKAILVHTAGGVSIRALAPFCSYYGVLYPLQSLRKERRGDIAIPLFMDGNDSEAKMAIQELARGLSDSVDWADDAKRMKLHVAAVFTSNFTNYLYALANRYCQDEQIDFQYLLPLIQETAGRLTSADPAMMQTGPAARKDADTINKHLELLKEDPEAAKVYQFLSDAIIHSAALQSGDT